MNKKTHDLVVGGSLAAAGAAAEVFTPSTGMASEALGRVQIGSVISVAVSAPDREPSAGVGGHDVTVGYTVRTNNSTGYWVTVQPNYTSASEPSSDETLPTNLLSMDQDGSRAHLAPGSQTLMHDQALRSDATGESMTTSYRLDSAETEGYQVELAYVATPAS